MGWTFTRRHDGMTDAAFFAAEFPSITFLDSAKVGSTFYAKCTRTTASGERPVFAVVILTKNDSRAADGYNFGYKEMDETMGPCECAAPLRLLDGLTEPDGEYARNWRERVRAYHRDRAAFQKAKPRPGQVIELKEPVRFNDGETAQRFTVTTIQRRGKNRTYYQRADGTLCRIAGLQRIGFSVVG